MAKRRKATAQRTTPARRCCGAMQVHFRLLEEVPSFRQRQVDLEHASRAKLRTACAARVAPFKIRVVVHVLHNSSAEKISQVQVTSQIAVLNRDFRAKNPDKSNVPTIWKGLVADTMVEFELASEDPDGNATNGITYTKT